MHNHLILAFKETLHNSNYVAGKHIFESKDVEAMISLVKRTLEDSEELKACLDEQHRIAMLEDREAYVEL